MRTERSTSHPYRLALEARDGEALANALDPDVSFHAAPFEEPIQGRDNVLMFLAELGNVFEQVEFTDELWGDGSYVFTVGATLADGGQIEIVDHLQHDDDLVVKRLTTYARPLASLQAVAARLADAHAKLTGSASTND